MKVSTDMNIDLNVYYFTFGTNHAHPNGYVVIYSNSLENARAKMFERYGRAWAFSYTQYQWDELNMVAKYNLTEVI